MAADGVISSTIENQKQIIGSGQGAMGISVNSGNDPLVGDRNNLVSNSDHVTVSGIGAVGVSVSGDRNVTLNGNGPVAFPATAFSSPWYIHRNAPYGNDLFPNSRFFSSELDRATDKTIDPVTGLPMNPLPNGVISVTGLNSIGIKVTGNNNLIGQVNSQRAEPTTVQATGTGSIGVQMGGNSNVFVNGGLVSADGSAIVGGTGSDTVVNAGLIYGDIQLITGDDQLIVPVGATLTGTADGGGGRDSLLMFVGTSDPVIGVIDGSQYVNFEDFAKLGGGTMMLTGSLRVTESDLIDGTLQETSTARLITSGNTTRIHSGARLSGDGTTVGRVAVMGGVLSPGTDNAMGTMTIEGDLQLSGGILEFAAVSPIDTDRLDILGNATFSGGFLDILLGFTPGPGDVIDMLVNAQSLSLLNGFRGIRGFALAGSGVPIGTPFQVNLGGQIFQGTTAAPVPTPAAIWLFGSALIGLLAIRRRNRS